MAIEKEIKLEIPDKVSFEKLKMVLGQEAILSHQTNWYFDTKTKILQSHAIMFRLREEKDRKIFTLKRNSSSHNGVQICEEIEKEVSGFEVGHDDGSKFFLELYGQDLLGSEKLIVLGCIKNCRYLYQDFYGAKLELDETRIFEKCYYELELETEDIDFYQSKLKILLEEAGIVSTPSRSKYHRFLQEVQKESKA